MTGMSDEVLARLETEMAQDPTLPESVRAAILARARTIEVRRRRSGAPTERVPEVG